MVNRRKEFRVIYIAVFILGLYIIFASQWNTTISELSGFTSNNTITQDLKNKLSGCNGQDPKLSTSVEPLTNDEPQPSSIQHHSEKFYSDGDRKYHLRSLIPLFEKYRPYVNQPLGKYKNDIHAPEKAHDPNQLPMLTKEELYDYLIVPDDVKANLTKSHHDFVENLPKEYPKGLYNGKGVVYTSGGKYLPIMAVSLRLLRKVSPSIPVEVFLANTDEYEPEICDKLFPSLGAKCVVLEEVYGQEFFKSFHITGYQLKVLAILASSFEDVIFIDADNMPLRNVEDSLTREPYVSTGYIVWPDFWFRTTSSHYYDIAGIELGERVRGDLSVTDPKMIPQADLKNAIPNKSTESGQLMVNKAKHYRSLLLSAYYNLNGHSGGYYKIFSQGSGGEGDKETFIASALVLGEPIYQIKTDLRSSGRHTDKGFQGSAMLQAVPYDDYEKHVLKTRPEDLRPRILFVHFNMHKLNLRMMLYGAEKDRFSSDENRIRYCGRPSDNTEVFDFLDFEFFMWREVAWTACEMPKLGINFKDWKDTNVQEMCTKVQDHLKWLIKTHSV